MYKIAFYDNTLQFNYNKIYDILFIYPNMEYINGINLVKKIQNKYHPKIIMISSNPHYMHLSFDIQAFHFINKAI